MHEEALALLADDLAGRAPREVVHLPEGHEREDEREEGDPEDVDEHPANVLELAVQDEDDDLEAVDGAEHDEGERRDRLVLADDHVDELRAAGLGSALFLPREAHTGEQRRT